MFYKVDFDINTFQFWSGAKSRMDDATYDQIRAVADRIEECFSYDNIPTDTEINDFVWFECDDIFFPEEEEEEEDSDDEEDDDWDEDEESEEEEEECEAIDRNKFEDND